MFLCRRRLSEKKGRNDPQLSQHVHKDILLELCIDFLPVPNTPKSNNFSPLQPWSQPRFISQNVTRSSGHAPPFATQFFHFCIFPLSISSLSFALISIISYWSVSRGEKPTPTSIYRHTAKSSNTTWNMGVDSLRCWQKWLIWSQQIEDRVCKISFLMFSRREMQKKTIN